MTRMWNAITAFLTDMWTRVADVLTNVRDLALDLPLVHVAVVGALVALIGAAVVLAHRRANR
jgi:hypothetical protein